MIYPQDQQIKAQVQTRVLERLPLSFHPPKYGLNQMRKLVAIGSDISHKCLCKIQMEYQPTVVGKVDIVLRSLKPGSSDLGTHEDNLRRFRVFFKMIN